MRAAVRERGFILSMEAVLLFSILCIGLLVGVVVLRDALFKYYLSRQDTRFFVADSSEPAVYVGNVVGFDEHEAPLLAFIDYHDADSNPLPNGMNFRMLVGVRDDRFTTRQVAFYAVSDCAGPPVCVAAPSSEYAHSLVRNQVTASGTVSYVNSLQGNGPSYAIGRNTAASLSQDLLFRSTAQQCNVDLLSMWVSQTVAPSPQESCVNLSTPISGTNLAAFLVAEPVNTPGGTRNVLEGLTPPFYINMVDNPLLSLTRTNPDGEGI